MRDKIIRIEWSAPLLIKDAIASPQSKSVGLYYITRLFGSKETSLYIGKSAYSIYSRLLVHERDWVHNYRGKIYVRLGQIVYPLNPDTGIIDHAESALILEHNEILKYNTCKANTYSYSELYRIENIGDYFQLKSNIRMKEHA